MPRRRPLMIEASQGLVRWAARMMMMGFFSIRVRGLENYPAEDGFLICANHQSFLDPIVLGVCCPRPINYLGRVSLFRFKPLGWFLKLNDTIPIDRDASGIGGLKETMRRLKRQESVMMFPEGTRSSDGEIQPIKFGFAPVARRAQAALVPIGFDGAYQAYPRHRSYPLPGRIHVVIGQPIAWDDYRELSNDELGALLEMRLKVCFDEARSWRRA